MWVWLRRYAVALYDTDWLIRGFEEFERIFGRKPFVSAQEDVPKERVQDAYRRVREAMTVHFGEGRLNPSSVAWMIAS
jgi:hypothetical protein